MSRTWKHAPHAVRAWRARNSKDAEVWHSLNCEKTEWRWIRARDRELHPCNVEDYDPRLRHEYGGRDTCQWELRWPYPFVNNVGYSGARQAYRDEYNGKRRAGDRAVSRDAVKEYNGSGDCEPDYMDGRTRHSVAWDME